MQSVIRMSAAKVEPDFTVFGMTNPAGAGAGTGAGFSN